MSPPAHPAKEEKHDDHPKDEKKKMTFGGVLIAIALGLLFLVIFFFVVNPLLGMLFPSITESIRIVGQGLQSSGTELVRTNIALGIFMSALFGLLIRFLIIILGFALTIKLGMMIAEWVKPQAPAGAAH